MDNGASQQQAQDQAQKKLCPAHDGWVRMGLDREYELYDELVQGGRTGAVGTAEERTKWWSTRERADLEAACLALHRALLLPHAPAPLLFTIIMPAHDISTEIVTLTRQVSALLSRSPGSHARLGTVPCLCSS